MTATKSSQLSNAIARRYFLHDLDTHHDTDQRCCYFSEHAPEYDDSGWGFWVRPDGTVDTDEISANGDLPSSRIVEACKRAAVKFLAS
jgi:hypothetical protein